MDKLDLKILNKLSNQARITLAELASDLGISSPAISERIKKHEEKGVISRYAAIINPESVNINITAFIAVTLQAPNSRNDFIELVNKLPEIQECHHIAGNEDYFLKVRCSSIRDLESLLSNKLKDKNIAYKTNSTIVLSTVKETTALPLESGNVFKE